MLPLTNPQAIRQIVQLSADLCEENRGRCAHQLVYLRTQRSALKMQRQKQAERHHAETARLSALCEAMGLETIPM